MASCTTPSSTSVILYSGNPVLSQSCTQAILYSGRRTHPSCVWSVGYNGDTMDAEFRSALTNAIERFGLDALPPEQLEQLIRHYRMLGEWNKRVNLTRIIEPSEAARLH